MSELEELREEKVFLQKEIIRLIGIIHAQQNTIDDLRRHRPREEPHWALYKGQRDEGIYVAWSGIADGPCLVGTRADMYNRGYTGERLDRADRNGTSSMIEKDWWGEGGYLIADQRGILRRQNIVEYSRLFLAGEYDKAYDLLEPFED